MQPRETIPNVGRRAQDRRGVDTLAMKGNRVHAAKTTTTTLKLLLPADPGSPQSQSEDVHLYVHMNGHQEDSVGEASQHHHHHPYSRAMKRILHRNQVTTGQQTHTDTQQHSTDLAEPSPSTTRHNMNRTSRLLSDLHHGGRPKNRASRTDKHQTKSRWQGSRHMRRHERSETIKPTQSLYKLAKQSETRSTLDLSRGCLTGRNPAYYLNDDLEDRRFEMLDTTRSEPPNVSRLSKDLSRLPEVLKIRNTEPLDELLDYYWVYQCMGRQVLNLDLPPEIWDRKMFKKRAMLPPIPSSHGHRGVDTDAEGRSSTHPEFKAHHAEKTSKERRLVSETARETDSQFADASDDVVRPAMRAADTEDSKAGGLVVGRQNRRGHNTPGTAGTMKLVVKMPVFTRDITLADLPDKE